MDQRRARCLVADRPVYEILRAMTDPLPPPPRDHDQEEEQGNDQDGDQGHGTSRTPARSSEPRTPSLPSEIIDGPPEDVTSPLDLSLLRAELQRSLQTCRPRSRSLLSTGSFLALSACPPLSLSVSPSRSPSAAGAASARAEPLAQPTI